MYYRRQEYTWPALIFVLSIWAFSALLGLAFWGGVIYVVVHFLLKWW